MSSKKSKVVIFSVLSLTASFISKSLISILESQIEFTLKDVMHLASSSFSLNK